MFSEGAGTVDKEFYCSNYIDLATLSNLLTLE